MNPTHMAMSKAMVNIRVPSKPLLENKLEEVIVLPVDERRSSGRVRGSGSTEPLILGLTAYPTPADAETMLTFPPELKGVKFQVSDMQGKLVAEGRLESAGLHRLRTSQLADGVYSIALMGSSITGRVLVQH